MKTALLSLLFLCSPLTAEIRSDINKDGKVDLLDLSILTEEWLMSDRYLQFSGNSFIEVPNSVSYNMAFEDFSVSFWVKPVSKVDSQWILSCINSAATLGWMVWLESNEVKTEIIWGQSSVVGFPTHTPLSETKWSNVVITYDRSDIAKLYINGIFIISYDISSLETKDISANDGLLIGDFTTGGAGPLEGDLDEIRIYKGNILSQEQITALYYDGEGKKAKDADFIDGWYSNFDEGTGDVVSGRTIISEVASDLDGIMEDPNEILWRPNGVPFIKRTHLHIANYIREKYKTKIADVYNITTQYDNHKLDPPNDELWVRANILFGATLNASSGVYRSIGILSLQLFSPIKTGDQDAFRLAVKIFNEFSSKRFGPLVFKTVRIIRTPRRQGAFWQVNVNCPFYFETIT